MKKKRKNEKMGEKKKEIWKKNEKMKKWKKNEENEKRWGMEGMKGWGGGETKKNGEK